MDKLTSQLENFFAVDDETEGAAGAAAQAPPTEEDESLIDTSEKPAISEGDQVAERSLAEANKASTLEEKEKLLSAVKQNVD